MSREETKLQLIETRTLSLSLSGSKFDLLASNILHDGFSRPVTGTAVESLLISQSFGGKAVTMEKSEGE